MTLEDLYNELSRIKHQAIFTKIGKARLYLEWIEEYSKENEISFDTALNNLRDYTIQKEKG